jgi:hypothetical protein
VKDHFVALRVGLFDHVEDGRMTPPMLSVFLVILRQADYETGMWRGCAKRLYQALGEQIELRVIKHALRRLFKDGYLKSFRKPGSRKNYLVAINKYAIRFGKWNGYRLNAAATHDPNAPVYVQVQEPAERTHPSASQNDGLAAAQAAFDLFSGQAYGDMGSDPLTALRMVLWTIYRAAVVKENPLIPPSLAYYEATRANFMEQHEIGWEQVLETAEAKFEKHAYEFIQSESPALLDWLVNQREEVAALSLPDGNGATDSESAEYEGHGNVS